MAAPTPRTGWWRFSLSRRAERVLNIITIVLALLLVLGIVLWRVPSNYQLLLPATAQPVDPQIYVAGHPPPSGRGQFMMTFVDEPNDTSLLMEIFGRFDPDATLQPLPAHYSQQQEVQQGKADMISSEQTAELVALCQVGYKNLCHGGVLIDKVEPYSKAANVLRAQDLILSVDGKPTETPDALRAALATKAPGSTFTIQFQRGSQILVRSVQSVRSPTRPYGTVLGIEIEAATVTTMPGSLPIDMKINPGNIGGPSAGLMFTLGLLNRLSPTDLTHGKQIAGTGTISVDGSVGPIGGVKQKVIGAEWAHAQYFFVPRDNYADAQKAVGPHMKLVPVSSLADALAFLKTLK